MRIDGTAGPDNLIGTTGADTIQGYEGTDAFQGLDGDDILSGNQGADFFQGGAGHDRIHGGQDNDIANGEDGDDLINGHRGNDTLSGGAGADDIRGHNGDDRIDGGDGNDRLAGNQNADSILGGSGDDTIWGGKDNDHVLGEAGADLIYGNQGHDILDPGEGHALDRVYGGGGNDTLLWNPGATEIPTGWDADNAGPEFWANFHGGAGDDRIQVINDMTHYSNITERTGTPAPTEIVITAQNADGSADGRVMMGGPDYNDTEGGLVLWFTSVSAFEVEGNNSLRYANQTDAAAVVVGTIHNDTLLGGNGNETLDGGEGDDRIAGGGGTDVLLSSPTDADVFVVRAHSEADSILGFNGAATTSGDFIEFNESAGDFTNFTQTETDGRTVFTWDSGSLTVDAVGLSGFSDYGFILPA